MKTCPNCGAASFDDARCCFECMYLFQKEESNHHGEVLAQGSVVIRKESAPEGALEITMRFEEPYLSFWASSSSDCDCRIASISR